MEPRKRAVVAAIWVLVAAVMATTVELAVPTTANEFGRIAVVSLAVFLAVVYLLDPVGVVSQGPFEYVEE